MRIFLLAATTASLLAAAPVSAQNDDSGLMSQPEIAAFRADWRNWSHCAALGAFYSFISEDPQEKTAYQGMAQGAARTGASFALVQGADRAAFDAETERYVLWIEANVATAAELLGAQILQCHASGVFESAPASAPSQAAPQVAGPATNPLASPAPAPQAAPRAAPQAAASPASAAPLGYTIALSVNGQGGGVTYTRTNVPGQLTGRWALIDGSIKGEETATRAGGAAADGSLAGSYTTSGISNGSRYTGRLNMSARGTAAGGAIRMYDLAWDNGDRGFGLEEGPWLHVVYGAAATGLITPSADGGGWELVWVGPEGNSFAAGKVFWRGSLTGTHMADDPDAGTSFPIEVTETAPGTLRVILPGGFAGIALKAG